MLSIDRLLPFCQTMICRGKIPYLLPCIRIDAGEVREIQYQTKGKRPLADMMVKGLGEDVFRIVRRIIYCYYDLESEYFVPGRCLCLELSQIYLDGDRELYFQVDDAGRYQLYPVIRTLLTGYWQDQCLIPESREEWISLIEECEVKEKLTRRLIQAQEEPEKPNQVEKGERLHRIARMRDELVRDDKKILCLWGLCFLLGVILSVFS